MDKNVTPEQKGIFVQTELAKRAVLRLNNQESNQLTKECISMAMMYLMREKSYEEISISEIAKKAGVSRTAFYRNYTSKDDVVREIGMLVIDKLSVIINNIKSKDDIHGMLIEFFSQIKEEKEQVSILLNGNLSLQMLFPNARIIENVIPSANLTDHYKMVAIDSALVGLVREWILNDCDIPESELADIIEPQITL